MALTTIAVASLLILLGVGSYLASGRASITAMIPAFFGLPLIVLGYVALKPAWRKHAMHAAAVLVLLGFLGTARGLVLLPRLLAGGPVDRPGAVVAQAIMAVLCGILLALYIKSFIDTRRERKQTQP